VTAAAFRRHLRAADDPRIAGISDMDAYSWAERMLAHPRAGPLFAAWRRRYEESGFVGITADGAPVPGLYALAAEGAPVAAMAEAADALLAAASPEQRARLCHPLDAREWRAWMNPEVYMHRYGLRLDEEPAATRAAVLAVLRASLSDAGYARARDLMRINHFLGELVRAPRVMNEFSYNFNLFGTPSRDAPWGWTFYGHHLCMACLALGGQMVLAPVFMGAEPNCIDAGPHAGVSAFTDEERLGLALMRSLAPAQRSRAQLYRAKRDPAMSPGRVALGDELHLAGAFQDNRVIPYEGVPASSIGAASRRALLELVACHLALLPHGPHAARMREIERHLDDTHFCWIGGDDDESAFYYRVQSPVLIVELDHHAGVFLGNPEPERFHVHTLVRAPNGNDYGMALVRAHCEARGRGGPG
jgi:hypothetical protein